MYVYVCFQLLTFEEATAALASKEYPLFVQFCRPPSVFVPEPTYPPVKLLSTLVFTNRSVERVDGEFRCVVMIPLPARVQRQLRRNRQMCVVSTYKDGYCCAETRPAVMLPTHERWKRLAYFYPASIKPVGFLGEGRCFPGGE